MTLVFSLVQKKKRKKTGYHFVIQLDGIYTIAQRLKNENYSTRLENKKPFQLKFCCLKHAEPLE